MSTRAQIGFYDSSDFGLGPTAIVYQHSDGYPTSKDGGVVKTLMRICPPLIEKRGAYDEEYLAAQTLYRLIFQHDEGASGLGFGISRTLHADTRFYYAVTPEGVYTFDARGLDDLNDVKAGAEMFFTSWAHDEKRRKVEKEIGELESRLKDLYNQRESVKRGQP